MMNIFLIIGVISIVISGVMIGAWSDGQRQRDYFHVDESEQRNSRLKSSILFALIGILSFFCHCWIYVLFINMYIYKMHELQKSNSSCTQLSCKLTLYLKSRLHFRKSINNKRALL